MTIAMWIVQNFCNTPVIIPCPCDVIIKEFILLGIPLDVSYTRNV